MTSSEEDTLIRGCIHFNRKAQNQLYKKFAAKMFAVCYQYTRSREDAEDIFHEGFMKVFNNIKKFARTGSLEGWIRRIMINTAIEKYRSNAHLSVVVKYEDNPAWLNDYYTDDLLDRIEAEELLKLIQKLPPAYKMVFNLYVFEGMMHKEIADQLGISVGTSKSNLFEAKAILKSQIHKLYNQEEVVEIRYGRR